MVDVDNGSSSDVKKMKDATLEATISSSTTNSKDEEEEKEKEEDDNDIPVRPKSSPDQIDDIPMEEEEEDREDKIKNNNDQDEEKKDNNDGKISPPEETTGDEKEKEEAEKKRIEDLKKKYANWPLREVHEPHDNDVLYGRGGKSNQVTRCRSLRLRVILTHHLWCLLGRWNQSSCR
jgi:hypothetical protein